MQNHPEQAVEEAAAKHVVEIDQIAGDTIGFFEVIDDVFVGVQMMRHL